MLMNLLSGGVLPERVPVIVVGAGAAGITLALSLHQSRIPVLLLEAGGDRIDDAGQDVYRAASISPADHGPVHRFRHRAFGGTTAVWGGRCIPFDPIDFEDRDWIPDARWPITYEEVEKFYPAALSLCRAGAPDFSAGAALPGSPAGMFDLDDPDVIVDRIERFSEPTHFGRFYRRALETSEHVTVALNAPVRSIDTIGGGRRIAGVTVRMPDGSDIAVRASRVVVAAGGLETPRLLLSSSHEKPCGLGNERDQVGRYYQSHLEGHIGEIAIAPQIETRLDYERSADGTYCRRYLWLSPSAQRAGRMAGLILRPTHAKVADPAHRDPVLSAMFMTKSLLLPEYARSMTLTEQAAAQAIGRHAAYAGHLRNIVAGSPRLVRFASDWVRRRSLATRKLPSVFLPRKDGRYPLDVNAEQSPNSDSRVFLSDRHDALGMRRLDIDWRLRPLDRAMVGRGMRAIQQSIARTSGVRLILGDKELEQGLAGLTRTGGHHIGTARMADSPGEGVVDRDCQTFDVEGLHVAGAAVFPTSGFANPTLTLVALALRLAQHIASQDWAIMF